MVARSRRIPFVLCAFVLGASLRMTAAADGEWRSNGPYGAYVRAVAASSGDPSVVYLATNLGIYRSVDAGSHWTLTSLAGYFDLVVATSDPAIAYVSRPDEFDVLIQRTLDGGASWSERRGPRGRLGSLSSDPADPMTLYAMTTSGGRFRSTDAGESWDPLTAPVQVSEFPPTPGGMTGIAVDPENSNHLYTAVMASSPGVYRSTDRGATWVLTNLRVPSYGLLFAADGSRLYAYTAQGLQVSTNRGQSWERIALRQPAPTYVAIDPSNSRVLYLIYNGAVYYSSDGGETTQRVDGNFAPGPLKIAAAGSSVALVGSSFGISRTEDAGRHWNEANIGLREIIPGSLAVDPKDPAVVFASHGTGLFETRDGGETWSGPIPGSPNANAVVIDPSESSTLYVGGLGVQKSTDGGRTWQVKTPVDEGGLVNSIAALLIDPNNRRRLFASSTSVYRTGNGGDSWDRVMRPDDDYWTYSYYYYPGPPTVTDIVIAPTDGATLYAGGWESGGFLYRSADGGSTWSDLRNGFEILSLEVDACDPQILHAGSPHGVYRTIDGGASWKLPANPDPFYPSAFFIHALARDPRHPSSVFAGTSRGLYWSIDRGATWAKFEPALDETVVSIALDPTGRFLYAGTQRGVFTLERTFEECRDGPDRLCLIASKYQVSVTARHPATGAPITGHAIAEDDRFGYFSFPDVTGDSNVPEVFVKMVNASGAPAPYGGHDWVFHTSLTDLDYTVTVRETATGRVRTYTAAHSASLTCGAADTSAFVRACEVEASASSVPHTRLAAGSGTELSLLGGRFRATIRATDPRTGRTAEGAAISRGDGFGYFSLPGFTGDATFPEVFVKMVDGRSQPGGSFWVFHTGLTDVEYTLTVTDSRTGATKTYPRGGTDGSRLCGFADTRAFHD